MLSKAEYNVTMLYQEDEEFVGVKEWLGDEYANLPHENISSETTSVSPSDILFIPEIFANVMSQTKQLPCKRIAILQNYDFIMEQMPLSVQWGDLNIMDAIVNTSENETLLKNLFPYVRTQVVNPSLDNRIGDDGKPKKLIVNIISKNPSNVNRIVKPFYWSYPAFKWVTFRDIRGFDKETYAKYVREAALTIWIDEEAPFGYSALEAMKSGSIVLAKLPNNKPSWIVDKDGMLTSGCLWFENIREVPSMVASLVRRWITNAVPSEITKDGKEIASEYTEARTSDEITKYVSTIFEKRKQELENLKQSIKGQKE